MFNIPKRHLISLKSSVRKKGGRQTTYSPRGLVIRERWGGLEMGRRGSSHRVNPSVDFRPRIDFKVLEELLLGYGDVGAWNRGWLLSCRGEKWWVCYSNSYCHTYTWFCIGYYHILFSHFYCRFLFPTRKYYVQNVRKKQKKFCFHHLDTRELVKCNKNQYYYTDNHLVLKQKKRWRKTECSVLELGRIWGPFDIMYIKL